MEKREEMIKIDYDKSIHSNPDAMAWAKFFMETKKLNNWTTEQIDEGLMLAWFASAMMAMYDYTKQSHPPITEEEFKKFVDKDISETAFTYDDEVSKREMAELIFFHFTLTKKG
jgi:hypothetical protein